MTTPSGQIALSQVNEELDVSPTSTQINMGSAPVRGLAEVPSGAIAMSDLQNKSNAQYVAASGGTESTSGNYKIHVFNSSGTFTVNVGGNAAGSNTVDYMVVAGGGAGAKVPGGGAGGYRESNPSPGSEWTGSPLASPGGALPVSAQAYPITVGAGGTGPAHNNSLPAPSGSNSIFSNITSAGGGGGGGVGPEPRQGGSGGSGGGSVGSPSSPLAGGSGNSPPVSPPQGSNGGLGGARTISPPQRYSGAGGGGATAVGGAAPSGAGGAGTSTSITASPLSYSGGGGGGQGTPDNPAQPAKPGGSGGGGNGQPNSDPNFNKAGGGNQGGGGGGGAFRNDPGFGGGNGGSGQVVIRYKFQGS